MAFTEDEAAYLKSQPPAAAAARQGPATTARLTCPSLKNWAGSLPESHSRDTAQTGIAGAARP
jgi:hypothetical protein